MAPNATLVRPTTVRPAPAVPRSHFRCVAFYAFFVALSAAAGAYGLWSGTLALPPTLAARLPFQSSELAAVALFACVAVPFAALARFAQRNDRRTDLLAVLAGTVLTGWILVQVLLLSTFSTTHLFYLGVAATFLALGRTAIPTRRFTD